MSGFFIILLLITKNFAIMKKNTIREKNMATYYIDPVYGLDTNDGLCEKSPLRDYKKIKLAGGDSVLFKCGSFYREPLKNVHGNTGDIITYSSYGEGEKPTFCGSVDVLCDENCWVEEEKNIWVAGCIDDEACNFIFDGGKSCGTLRWEKEDLCEQGDFFDNMFGTRVKGASLGGGHKIYMYSEKNPALFYEHIELACYGSRFLATNSQNTTFENLRFINSGVHGIAGDVSARNLTVKGCDFEFIGGCVWSKEKKIRFGNAFECWNIAENVTVTDCLFYEIYDSGVTHQGSKSECEPCENVHFDNNIFIKCGMASYEQRDLFPKSATFCRNICINAGEGFSKLGEQMPRRSEIWPSPMGHHIFLWRIEKETEGGYLEIKDNIFAGAKNGASIYSIIEPSAEKGLIFEGNTFCDFDGDLMIANLSGKRVKSLEEYKDNFEPTALCADKCDILRKCGNIL